VKNIIIKEEKQKSPKPHLAPKNDPSVISKMATVNTSIQVALNLIDMAETIQ